MFVLVKAVFFPLPSDILKEHVILRKFSGHQLRGRKCLVLGSVESTLEPKFD